MDRASRAGVVFGAVLAALGFGVVPHLACGRDPVQTGTDATDDVSAPRIDAGRDAEPISTDAQPPTDASKTRVDAAFLVEPTLWNQVPGAAACTLLQLVPSEDPFPRRSWESCGTGCRVGEGPLPIEGAGASILAAAAGTSSKGELLLSLQMGVIGTSLFQHVIRVSDEKTVTAVQVRGDLVKCGIGGTGSGVANLITPTYFPDNQATQWMFGRVRDGGSIDWQTSWVAAADYPLERFMFDDGHGLVYQSGQVALLSSSQQGTFALPPTGEGSPLAQVSNGALFAVSRLLGDGGGALEVIQADAGSDRRSTALPIIAMGADDQRISWVEVTGAPAKIAAGEYASARIRWSMRSGASFDVTSAPSVELLSGPFLSGFKPVRVSGNYAATVGCALAAGPDPECSLFVVRLTDSKIFKIGPRPGGNQFSSVLGLSSTELLVAENDSPSHPPFGALERIVRLELEKLEKLSW